MSKWKGPRPDDAAENLLHEVIDAWEALQGGQNVSIRDAEKWLADDMAPAINKVRAYLNREPYSERKK